MARSHSVLDRFSWNLKQLCTILFPICLPSLVSGFSCLRKFWTKTSQKVRFRKIQISREVEWVGVWFSRYMLSLVRGITYWNGTTLTLLVIKWGNFEVRFFGNSTISGTISKKSDFKITPILLWVELERCRSSMLCPQPSLTYPVKIRLLLSQIRAKFEFYENALLAMFLSRTFLTSKRRPRGRGGSPFQSHQ